MTGDALEAYKKLNEIVGKEISKGITKSDNQIILNSIKQKIEYLKRKPQFGVHISRNKIPKEYVLRYDVNNLWKIDLSKYWRMIYTIKGDEVRIISLILDIFNHNKYNKKFKYRKN